MIIYKTTNLINGKIYIGKDSNNNPNYYGSGVNLIKAIKKYGKENFVKEILEYCVGTKQDLNEMEIHWIKLLNSLDKKIGYNIAPGGEGGVGSNKPKSEEHRKNISKYHADVSGEKNPMFGRKHTDEVKDLIRSKHIGMKMTDECKLKMSENKKGERNNNSKLSEYDVLKIREIYSNKVYNIKEISLIYNVQKACIHKIVNYITWKHI
jgi:group I intron endonuclease